MVNFDEFDIEEKRGKPIPISDNYEKYIGHLVIIKDDSEYSGQNPTDVHGNKIPGVLYHRTGYKGPDGDFIFDVSWKDFRDAYRRKDLLLV